MVCKWSKKSARFPLLGFSSKWCPTELKERHFHVYAWLKRYKNYTLSSIVVWDICNWLHALQKFIRGTEFCLLKIKAAIKKTDTQTLGDSKCIEDGEVVWSWGVSIGWEVIHYIFHTACLRIIRMRRNEATDSMIGMFCADRLLLLLWVHLLLFCSI